MSKFVTLTAIALIAAAGPSLAQQIEPMPTLPNTASPETVELGRLLFFDARLSGDSSTACSDCHDPNYGFGDGAELSRGYPGTKHWRNSQTIVNSAYLKNGLHWDGTVPSFLDQVPGAMSTPFASNMNVEMAEERLLQIPGYAQRFNDIWGEAPSIERIAEAIAAYENSLVSLDSPFDQFASGDFAALSQEALRGMAIFQGKGNCSACHSGPAFTDENFHNTSVPPVADFLDDPLVQVSFRFSMRSFGVDPDVYMNLDRDPGYYAVTKAPEDLGKLRTPPLRYLKYTAPYMHNGAFFTLEEVVAFYNAGGTQDVFGTKSDRIQPLGLTAQEQSDLVAFLESMSGTELLEEQPDLPDYEPITVEGAQRFSFDEFASSTTDQGADTGAVPSTSSIASEGFGLVISGASADIGQPDQEGRYVVVSQGETLGTIAKREYGDVLRYLDILEANRDTIQDPNNLTSGMRLRIP